MTQEAAVKVKVNVSGTLLFKAADGSIKEVPFSGQSVPMPIEEAQRVVESVEMELKK